MFIHNFKSFFIDFIDMTESKPEEKAPSFIEKPQALEVFEGM